MEIPEEEKSQQAKRHAIQAIMRDKALTAPQKQAAIQTFMASGGVAEPNNVDNSVADTDAAVVLTDTITVQWPVVEANPTTTTTTTTTTDDTSSVVAVVSVGTAADTDAPTSSNGSSVGAFSSTDADDIVQHKTASAARASFNSNAATAANIGEALNGDYIVPQAVEPGVATRVGSVASTSADPVERKGRPTQSSNAATTTPSNRRSTAGASASSPTDDPALRKGTRTSNRSSATTSKSTSMNRSSQNENVQHSMLAQSTPLLETADNTTNTTTTTTTTTATNTAAERASVLDSVTSERDSAQDTSVLDENTVEMSVPIAPESLRAVPTDNDTYVSSSSYLPASSPIDLEQQGTYAGLSYNPDGIAGGADGGIQAYVATDQVEAEAIDAVGVVTENELKAEENAKKRKCLFRGISLFIVLLLLVILPVVIVQGNKKDPGPPIELNITASPTDVPSSAPTSSTYFELLTALEALYGDNNELFTVAFSDPLSPQSKAATWAADVAPLGLSGDDPRMMSRFSLAVLYFATNGDNWVRCGRRSTRCSVTEEWLTAENECDWYAITCKDPANDDFTVLRIFFPPNSGDPNNMIGTLPIELAFLPELEWFIVANEQISGPFPNWAQLTTLQQVIINRNMLSGPFPGFLLEQNPLLGTIHLLENSITGSLPAFALSTSLKDLRVSQNSFTGSIPDEIANLPSLVTLYLDNNILTSTLPIGLYTLTELRNIRLSNNTGLSGDLSGGIGALSVLSNLQVTNTSMGGELPTALFGLSDLQDLDLSIGAFGGQVPELFSQLTNIGSIKLTDNSFSGPIPSSSFASLPFLETLELAGNDLTGVIAVGSELCNQRGEGFGDLKVLTTDCTTQEVVCECCTLCA